MEDIGDRMKGYEKINSYQLLPKVPVIARIDGKAFHTFCRGLEKPYDVRLNKLMKDTCYELVKKTHAIVGYTQSDEISLVWNYSGINQQMHFKGKVEKLTSILASIATEYFNRNKHELLPEKANTPAYFDCRVFNVPFTYEVVNYLIWRELDATRNSIQSAGQYYFSHKQLHGKSTSQIQEMLFKNFNVNWNDYPVFFKRGTYMTKNGRLRIPPILKIEDRTSFFFGE